jgi:integrase
MKNKMEFITPLSSYAINLLKSIPKVHGTNLIFPGARLQPISDNTLSKMMREMVSDGLITKGVPHGLRSSAQVYRRNFTNYSHEIGELTLSHKVGSEVSQSYNHGDALRHRMSFLEDWGKFCNTPFLKEITIPNHLKIAS